jgi:epoxyqueuosine reductase
VSGVAPEVALAALRHELATEGLHVVRVVTQRALDARGLPVQLGDLLSGATAALVVGDGGSDFFARFSARSSAGFSARFHAALPGVDAGAHPLDDYTSRVVPAAVSRAASQQQPAFAFAVRHPFSRDLRLPVQRIGEAAGLPPPGPLGLQVHPRFGPWWAYRALVVLDLALQDEAPLDRPCAGCPAPCVTACPGGATTTAGLQVSACIAERLASPACQGSCAARIACIAGPEHRYPAAQLGFHMGHSLRMIRSYRG